MKSIIYLSFAITFLMACKSTTETKSSQEENINSIFKGAWTWDSMTWEYEDTIIIWNDVYGQILFTENHYNYIVIKQPGLRDRIPDMSEKMRFETFTGSELYNILGKVTSHAGTYKFKNDTIWFDREVSLWPNDMIPGSDIWYRVPFSITKDTIQWQKGNYWVRMN